VASGVIAPVYTKDILRLAASLDAPRVPERIDGRATLRAPTCGSTIETEVMIDDGRIAALSQKVTACAFGQASAALAAASATGKSADDVAAVLTELTAWLDGERDDPGSWPGLKALEPARSKSARHGAIRLPFRALLAAIEDART
jgi:NifU-like protein involved in Fe-S cluster formation